jgi:hypothetical protein
MMTRSARWGVRIESSAFLVGCLLFALGDAFLGIFWWARSLWAGVACRDRAKGHFEEAKASFASVPVCAVCIYRGERLE